FIDVQHFAVPCEHHNAGILRLWFGERADLLGAALGLRHRGALLLVVLRGRPRNAVTPRAGARRRANAWIAPVQGGAGFALPCPEDARVRISLITLMTAGVRQGGALSGHAARGKALRFLPETYSLIVNLVTKAADSQHGCHLHLLPILWHKLQCS